MNSSVNQSDSELLKIVCSHLKTVGAGAAAPP